MGQPGLSPAQPATVLSVHTEGGHTKGMNRRADTASPELF